MDSPPVKCVIYDCDGVLFDSLEANHKLYDHICTSAGRVPITPEELQFCHAHTVFESLTRLFRDYPELEQKAIDFWKHLDLAPFIDYLVMEPNVRETLGRLKGRSIYRAISTNRTTTMKHVMEKFELWPYFDMVVTALDVVKPKPDRESVDRILVTSGAGQEETLYVGDSEVDRQTAEAAGVRFVAYKNAAIASGALIHDHLALLDLLSPE